MNFPAGLPFRKLYTDPNIFIYLDYPDPSCMRFVKHFQLLLEEKEMRPMVIVKTDLPSCMQYGINSLFLVRRQTIFKDFTHYFGTLGFNGPKIYIKKLPTKTPEDFLMEIQDLGGKKETDEYIYC